MNPIAVDLEAGQVLWWCRCGRSAAQPYCDGAHKGGATYPMKFIAAATGKAWLCACKKTATPPYCDGSHKSTAASAD